MTKKDYILIAKAIIEAYELTYDKSRFEFREELIKQFDVALAIDNPLFDTSKFNEAIRGH